MDLNYLELGKASNFESSLCSLGESVPHKILNLVLRILLQAGPRQILQTTGSEIKIWAGGLDLGLIIRPCDRLQICFMIKYISISMVLRTNHDRER